MRTLVTAAIVRDLNHILGVPVARAVQLAATILENAAPAPLVQLGDPLRNADGRDGSPVVVPVGDSLALTVDVRRLEHEIERRLLQAMETVVPRRRGRPPLKERRGTR
jgi:hypothetical protein